MVKIVTPELSVGIQHTSLPYAESNGPNLAPIANSLSNMAQAAMRVEAEQKQKADTMQRYTALSSLTQFDTDSKLRAQQAIDGAMPNDTKLAQNIIDSQIKYEQEFIKTLPPDLQPEFAMRATSVREGIALDAHSSQDKLNNVYYKEDLKKGQNEAIIDISKNPGALEKWKTDMDARIDASGLSESEKYFAKQENARILETAGYGATVKNNRMATTQFSNDMATAAIQSGRELGVNPEDILTAISFETGGTFSTDARNPDGKHFGLIQFGPEEQRMYGIRPGMSVSEQMLAVTKFLKDRGVKPGMSMYDIYSTINAGSPGHYNARDGHNGGTPGTVADKVNQQMAGHRDKARAILGGTYDVPDNTDSDPRFSNVLYEDRIAAQTDAQRQVNLELSAQAAKQKAEREAQFNELMVGLNDNRYGQAEIDNARQQGWLTDYDQIKKAQDLVDGNNKDAESTRIFTERVGRGDTLDPTDPDNKKNMDNLFKQDQGEGRLQQMDQAYVADSIIPTFNATGMLPPKAVDTLAAMLNSNDGRKMIFAYDALNMIEDNNPNAYSTQVNEGIRNKVDIYDVLKYNLTPEQLLKELRPTADAEVMRAQDVRIDRVKKELDSPDNTKITFDAVIKSFGADQAEVGIQGQVMEDEWRALIAHNAKYGLTLEEANTKAITQLQRKWGTTTFDGKSTLMKNPPEKFYPAIGDSHDWTTRQARGEMGLASDEGIQLVSDHRTEQDILSGNPPSYLMLITKPGGAAELATGYPEINPALVPGIYKSGNIDIHNRPMVNNPNGGVSTVDSFSYELDGKHILIPSVSDEGKIMSNPEAIAYWRDKGQNLGVFKSAQDATRYALALHDQQDRQYLRGERNVKRIYFKPTEEDKAYHEKQVTINHIQAQIDEINRSTPGRPGAVLHVELNRQRQVLMERLDAAKKDLAGQEETVGKQYMTPAQQQLQDAQKIFAPLNNEMQSWTDPIDQWPKAQEWELLYNKIEALKKKVESEVMSKRSSQGVQ